MINGEALLFSGNCGYGKSTHLALMKKYYGGEIINDDKPAIRKVGGLWRAYGTPWSGKNHENINVSAPIKAVIFLDRKREKNELKPLKPIEALPYLLDGTTTNILPQSMERLLSYADDFLTSVPCYLLESLADEGAAERSAAALRSYKLQAASCKETGSGLTGRKNS